MCHLRKVTHQEEGLWETTVPRLLPDIKFWLVSDVDWGQGKQCSNRWWLDRTKADMPAFSRGAVVLELFSFILQGWRCLPTENCVQIRSKANTMVRSSSSSTWWSGCSPLSRVYIHFLSQNIGGKMLSVWTHFGDVASLHLLVWVSDMWHG